MAKGRAAQGQDRRTDLRIGDDLDAEDVGEARATVVAKGPEDEVLAFLVEDEDAGEHLCRGAPEVGGRGFVRTLHWVSRDWVAGNSYRRLPKGPARRGGRRRGVEGLSCIETVVLFDRSVRRSGVEILPRGMRVWYPQSGEGRYVFRIS